MVESSKILTVSYGTFSCTLEGFEDSFSTMKAIAEYFRDLAAGDRYFGAEPPTPDAEMLTRIAEREISRRVEMRASDTGIVLRASDPVPQDAVQDTPAVMARLAASRPAQTVADAPAMPDANPADTDAAGTAAEAEATAMPVMPPAPRRPAEQDMRREQARADAVDVTTQPTPAKITPPTPRRAEAPAHPDADSVAAKLQRIRAVVGGVSPVMAATTFAEDLEAAPSETDVATHALNTAKPLAMPVVDAVPPVETAFTDQSDDIDDVDETEPETEVTDNKAVVAAEPEAVATNDAADEMLDDDTADQADDLLSDTPQMAKASALSDAETDAVIARAMAVFGGADTADSDTVAASAPQASPVAPDQDAAPQDDTDDQISAVLRNLERAGLRGGSRDAETPQTASTDDDMDGPAVAADDTIARAVTPVAPRGRILRVTRRPRPAADMDDNDESSAASQDDADQVAAGESDSASPPSLSALIAAAHADNAESDLSGQDDAMDAKNQPVDDQPAPAAAPLAETADVASDGWDDGDDAPAPASDPFEESVATLDGADDLAVFNPKADKSTLSDEDEADLQRTLAALKAEIDAPEALAPTAAAMAVESADLSHAAKLRRDPLPDPSEADMSRIMSQADEALADPESSRRRNAIAHLKAAVAATEAARQLGETEAKGDATETAFRDDLEQVVRPRRAPRADGVTDRSDRPRPAPLKLVASQRVDLEEAPRSHVQPRRVATPAAATSGEADNFAEFAESMGATSLQDLLEAAAAYTAFVEGSEDFSRPHIMQKVRQTVSEDFSREDGLRSFGTLLRQGRIEKTRNGRFAVSDQTRFKPEAIAIGG